MEWFYQFFGKGEDMEGWQMGMRAFLMFFITLVLIRIAGMRAFGTKSAFDNVLVITLGAVLSRGIVGASPFFNVVFAGVVMSITYRLLAYISINNDFISHLIKRKEITIYKDGKLNEENMKICNLSTGDLMSGLREAGGINRLEDAEEVTMERSGQISVVRKLNNNEINHNL